MSTTEVKLQARAGIGGTPVNLASVLLRSPEGRGGSTPLVGPGLEQRAVNA